MDFWFGEICGRNGVKRPWKLYLLKSVFEIGEEGAKKLDLEISFAVF